jgi:hypothetical protein
VSSPSPVEPYDMVPPVAVPVVWASAVPARHSGASAISACLPAMLWWSPACDLFLVPVIRAEPPPGR